MSYNTETALLCCVLLSRFLGSAVPSYHGAPYMWLSATLLLPKAVTLSILPGCKGQYVLYDEPK